MRGKDVSSAAVVFADRFFMSEKSLAEISTLGGYIWADASGPADLARRLSRMPSARVLVSEYVQVNASLLKKAPQLRGIISYGAGYDHIEVQTAAERGVMVCNCRGENAQAVAELTFATLLALIRKIREADRWVRENGWSKQGRALPAWVAGRELYSKTMGIIGLGQIGTRVARIAAGFGMKVLGHDPFARPMTADLEPVPLEILLSGADFISLHVPLTDGTLNMIDARALREMKPGVFLINTSRGKVVDGSALWNALKEKRIAGAALDVFQEEPISADHPFTSLDNVILTPHLGGLTEEAGDRLSDSITRQIRDILLGRKPEGLIAPN